ncbi:hypothetical protein TWF481_002690 [Arthrobotrys musiformis]|uniref:Uncharacterized protein n=1 Tax=Arthrobotrys musiformis TaxID=47236 RepID=A0AAV9VQY6_9PEZI
MEEDADMMNGTKFHEEEFAGLLNQLKLVDNGKPDSSSTTAQDFMQIVPRTPQKENVFSQNVTSPKQYPNTSRGKKKQREKPPPLNSPLKTKQAQAQGTIKSGKAIPISPGHEVEEPEHKVGELKHEAGEFKHEVRELQHEGDEPEHEGDEPEHEGEEPEVVEPEDPESDESSSVDGSEDKRGIGALVKSGVFMFHVSCVMFITFENPKYQ